MARPSIELVTTERRRRWTRAEKERLVAASFAPGVSASDVAREAGLHVSQLFRWRKLLCERIAPPPPVPVPALVPVAVVPSPPPTPTEPSAKPGRVRRRGGVIEISLGGGRHLKVDRDVDAEALRRVLSVLEER